MTASTDNLLQKVCFSIQDEVRPCLDRLTLAEYSIDDSNEAFTIDDLGNRDSVTVRDGNNVNYDIDNLSNRYDSVGGSTLAYDAAGNLTTDKDGYQYQYDYENRITKIIKSGTTTVAEFTYDALGRRIKKVDSVGGTTRIYYYNNWQILSEYDGSNNYKKSYVYGNYIDEVLMSFVLPINSSCKYYVLDHLYSPAALLYYTGLTVERYEYDAYGNCQIMDASYNPRSSSLYSNPYYFTGRETDSLDSGNLKMMCYRHRYYDPYTGRFTAHDPLSYVESMSLYEYLVSDPVGWVDPYGLWGKHCGKDECEPGDLAYDILDTVIVPARVHPGFRDAIRIEEATSLGIDVATLAKILLMLKVGVPPAEIIAEAAKLGLDALALGYIRRTIRRIADELEEAGNWMFLQVQMKACEKDHYGIFWRCYRYRWAPGAVRWYECPGTTGIMKMYEDRVDAVYHIDDCKEKLDNDFNDKKDSPDELKRIWY